VTSFAKIVRIDEFEKLENPRYAKTLRQIKKVQTDEFQNPKIRVMPEFFVRNIYENSANS
jgi:hypothetical protein